MFQTFQKFAILTHIVILFFLSACTPHSANAPRKGPIKIGFVLATMNEERYLKDRDYFLAAAQALGAKVEFAACDNRVEVQTSKVENLLAKGVDVLVIQPVHTEAAAAIAKSAKQEGIPVIAYDRLIRNAPLDLYVTQNSFQLGVYQAEDAVAALKGKGNVVILSGEAGHSVADEITRGNLSVLARYPGIKVVVQQNHPGWSTAAALSTLENALTRYHNDIGAILANNDGMALGAIQALEEQKLVGKVFVAGADADIAAVRNVATGKQSLTILKSVRPLAEAAARAAVALARKEPVPTQDFLGNGVANIPVLNTPVEKVTKATLDQVIIQSGFHSALAVFGQGKS